MMVWRWAPARRRAAVVAAFCAALALAERPTYPDTGPLSDSIRVQRAREVVHRHALLQASQSQRRRACREGMVLAPFFTTHEDWQRHVRVAGSANQIRDLLDSVGRQGMCVTVVYDRLPADLLSSLASDHVSFHQVDLKEFDSHLSPNDSRFLVYEHLLQEHPEWPKVFLVDAFDVKASMDPFPHMEEDSLYVGTDATTLGRDPWMRSRFQELGGRYLEWFKKVDPNTATLNAGLVGGNRPVMLELLGSLRGVLTDGSLPARSSGGDVHVNMAALNWAVYTQFADRLATGPPVNSRYKRHEDGRTDVWFIHK